MSVAQVTPELRDAARRNVLRMRRFSSFVRITMTQNVVVQRTSVLQLVIVSVDLLELVTPANP